jgi:hypothetical protein
MREIWNSDLSTQQKVLLAAPLMQWLVQRQALAGTQPWA